jgi:hypothetical protein
MTYDIVLIRTLVCTRICALIYLGESKIKDDEARLSISVKLHFLRTCRVTSQHKEICIKFGMEEYKEFQAVSQTTVDHALRKLKER